MHDTSTHRPYTVSVKKSCIKFTCCTNQSTILSRTSVANGINLVSHALIVFVVAVVAAANRVPRFKQRYAFVTTPPGGGGGGASSMYALLDAAKCADALLLVLDCDAGVDERGDACLSCLTAQGMPTAYLTCQVRVRRVLAACTYRLPHLPGTTCTRGVYSRGVYVVYVYIVDTCRI